MVYCSFSFGNFYPLLFATLHFTGCYFWHHTLPGIALKLNWLKENVIIIQQETSFCGFGGRPRWSFDTCAHKDDFNCHSSLMFFWLFSFHVSFCNVPIRFWESWCQAICFLFLKKYPGVLFSVQSCNYLSKVILPVGREPEHERL